MPSTITATFAKPDQLTVFVEAKPDNAMAQGLVVQADVAGTWRVEGDSLTVVATETSVHTDGKKNALLDMFAKQIEDQVKEAVTKSATGKMKWDGPDKLTVTAEDGKSAVLQRVK